MRKTSSKGLAAFTSRRTLPSNNLNMEVHRLSKSIELAGGLAVWIHQGIVTHGELQPPRVGTAGVGSEQVRTAAEYAVAVAGGCRGGLKLHGHRGQLRGESFRHGELIFGQELRLVEAGADGIELRLDALGEVVEDVARDVRRVQPAICGHGAAVKGAHQRLGEVAVNVAVGRFGLARLLCPAGGKTIEALHLAAAYVVNGLPGRLTQGGPGHVVAAAIHEEHDLVEVGGGGKPVSVLDSVEVVAGGAEEEVGV